MEIWLVVNLGDRSSGGSNTIDNSYLVKGNIYGSANFGEKSSGGSNTISNKGKVKGNIFGSNNEGKKSSGGFNKIFNDWTVNGDIVGSGNLGDRSSGGSNAIENLKKVKGNIYGSFNLGKKSSGGFNTISNYGTANWLLGSYNLGTKSFGGSNTINNWGTAEAIFGSDNSDSSSGGFNTISNYETTATIFGSLNLHSSSGGFNTIYNYETTANIFGSNNVFSSIGGFNTIYNYGTTTMIFGSLNSISSSGGSNRIYNYGNALYIYGSVNSSYDSGGSNSIVNYGNIYLDIHGNVNSKYSSGGSNVIYNYGNVGKDIYGSKNIDHSSGGSNIIENYGLVGGSIYGSHNSGSSHSRGNIITNRGRVMGDIWGSFNNDTDSYGGDDTIANYGSVLGNIYGMDGNDTVIIGGGSFLGGVADGGDGTDTLGFDNMGTIDPSLIGTKYINFENFGIFGGNTTMVGTWNFPTWDLTIHNGNLYVNGTLVINLLTIGADGLLGGTGTIFGDIVNFGTIAPGNSIGTLTVNGNVTFMDGSVYLVEIAANGASDLLDINGKLTINGGTVVTALPRALYTNGRQWTIIKADSVNGQFDSLSTNLSNSQTLSLHLVYGSKTVKLVLYRKPFEELGETNNQKSVGSALDTIVGLAGGEMAATIISMDFDMNLTEIRQAMSAMSPEMYTAFGGVGLQINNSLDLAVAHRQTDSRIRKFFKASDGSSHEQEVSQTQWNFWAQSLGAKSDRDSDEDYMGHSQEMTGLVFGFDRSFLSKFTAGFNLGYSDSDIDFGNGHSGSVQGKHIGLYGTADLGSFFVDGTFSYGDFNNSAVREISFAGLYANGFSSFGSDGFSGRLRTGYEFSLSSNWLIAPMAGLSYGQLNLGSFTESGAAHLSVDIEEQKVESLVSSLGIQVAGRIELGNWRFLPRAELSWRREFKDDAPTISANFVDYPEAPFNVSGIEPVSDSTAIDMSFVGEYGKSLSFYLDYTALFGNGFTAHQAAVGVSYRF